MLSQMELMLHFWWCLAVSSPGDPMVDVRSSGKLLELLVLPPDKGQEKEKEKNFLGYSYYFNNKAVL